MGQETPAARRPKPSSRKRRLRRQASHRRGCDRRSPRGRPSVASVAIECSLELFLRDSVAHGASQSSPCGVQPCFTVAGIHRNVRLLFYAREIVHRIRRRADSHARGHMTQLQIVAGSATEVLQPHRALPQTPPRGSDEHPLRTRSADPRANLRRPRGRAADRPALP